MRFVVNDWTRETGVIERGIERKNKKAKLPALGAHKIFQKNFIDFCSKNDVIITSQNFRASFQNIKQGFSLWSYCHQSPLLLFPFLLPQKPNDLINLLHPRVTSR